jgi:hypothetical protein
LKKPIVLLGVLALVLALPLGASAAKAPALTIKTGATPSNTDEILILHGAFTYPGYWWDHTHLTVAVQDHPNADPVLVNAVHEAIATWDRVLRKEFGGLITMTDISSQLTANHKADIVVHYNPTAGGVVFGGVARCGDHKCQNVIVRSDLPEGYFGQEIIYSPLHLYRVTLHELGHALGLGHALPLLESTDLMGYGWPGLGEPVLSDCDLEGIAYVFQWAFEGSEPYPPTAATVDCRD